MPPRLDPGKLGRLDGDHQRIRDYDVRENEQKKKFTYFYTKQEIEDQKQREKDMTGNGGDNPSSKFNTVINNNNSNYASVSPQKPSNYDSNSKNDNKYSAPSGGLADKQNINQPKALVKPKNQGQFDQTSVQFSYVTNPGSKNGKSKERRKKQTEQELQEQEQKLKQDFEKEVTKKMQKKSKNQLIEVPMYFTQDELMSQFAQQRKQMDKMQQDITTYDRGGNKKLGRDQQPNSKYQTGGYDDVDDMMDDDFVPIDEGLLDDLFVKGEIQKRRDPFHFISSQNDKAKKDDTNKTSDQSTYDSYANSASSRVNTVKYSRLPNGMILNHDKESLKKQNDMLAKVNLRIAKNKVKNGEVQLPISMMDSKSISQFYSHLFSYAPCILDNAASKGDEFERFKLTLKFAFSILHNLTFQDVFQKSPLRPLPGETFEGHYIYHDVCNVFMESDLYAFDYVDKLTLKDVDISANDPTTYIHIENPGKFELYGNLTYRQKWKGNNMVVQLPGILKVKFFDQEGEDQIIEFQLPEYILAGYYYVGKPAMILINGPLVVVDKKNEVKAVVLFQGLLTEKNLCTVEYVANQRNDMKIVQGLIYKYDAKKTQSLTDRGKTFQVDNIKDLYDIEYKLERIQGNAIDYYEIEEIPQADWKNLELADPIPSEIALPSDMRFREDLILLNRDDKSKGKVWRGMMKDQYMKDYGTGTGTNKKGGKTTRKKPKRVY